jgi:predicted nucleic acid-binding protein
MVYLDTSVVLAELFAENRHPPESLWADSPVSSRLMQYELWVRIHRLGLAASHGEAAAELIAQLAWVELNASVLDRVMDSFPVALRTLDAIHVATLEFLHRQTKNVKLASYDSRMRAAAEALGIPLFPLNQA